MEYAYLLASLPSLELGGSLPITASQFLLSCEGVLRRDHWEDVRAIVEDRLSDVLTSEGRYFVDADIQLRNALARIRSQRTGVEAAGRMRAHAGFDTRIEETAVQAMAAGDPLERELILDRLRWTLLDELATLPAFGAQAVFAYAFQLQLVQKWADLTEQGGLAVAEQVVAGNLAGIDI